MPGFAGRWPVSVPPLSGEVAALSPWDHFLPFFVADLIPLLLLFALPLELAL